MRQQGFFDLRNQKNPNLNQFVSVVDGVIVPPGCCFHRWCLPVCAYKNLSPCQHSFTL